MSNPILSTLLIWAHFIRHFPSFGEGEIANLIGLII